MPVTADELLKVLAADTRIDPEDEDELDYKGVFFLCSQWGIQPVIKYPQGGYDWVNTIRKLAAHVLQHGNQPWQPPVSVMLTDDQIAVIEALHSHDAMQIYDLCKQMGITIDNDLSVTTQRLLDHVRNQ